MLLPPYVALAIMAGPPVYSPLRPKMTPFAAISPPITHGLRAGLKALSPWPIPSLRIFPASIVNSTLDDPSLVSITPQALLSVQGKHGSCSLSGMFIPQLLRPPRVKLHADTPKPQYNDLLVLSAPEKQKSVASRENLEDYNTTSFSSPNATHIPALSMNLASVHWNQAPAITTPPKPVPAVIIPPLHSLPPLAMCLVGSYNGTDHPIPPEPTCPVRIDTQTKPQYRLRTLTKRASPPVVCDLPTCPVGSFNGTDQPIPPGPVCPIRPDNQRQAISEVIGRPPVAPPAILSCSTTLDLQLIAAARNGVSSLDFTLDATRIEKSLLEPASVPSASTTRGRPRYHSTRLYALASFYVICFAAMLYFCKLASNSNHDEATCFITPVTFICAILGISWVWISSFLNSFKPSPRTAPDVPKTRKFRLKLKYRTKLRLRRIQNTIVAVEPIGPINGDDEPTITDSGEIEVEPVFETQEARPPVNMDVFDVTPPCMHVAGRRYNRCRMKKL